MFSTAYSALSSAYQSVVNYVRPVSHLSYQEQETLLRDGSYQEIEALLKTFKNENARHRCFRAVNHHIKQGREDIIELFLEQIDFESFDIEDFIYTSIESGRGLDFIHFILEKSQVGIQYSYY